MAFDDFSEAGNRFAIDIRCVAVFQDAGHLDACGRWNGDEYDFDFVFLYERTDVSATAQDRHAIDEDALVHQLVIEEPADFVRESRIISNLSKEGDAACLLRRR